jgi:hypothetical protein
MSKRFHNIVMNMVCESMNMCTEHRAQFHEFLVHLRFTHSTTTVAELWSSNEHPSDAPDERWVTVPHEEGVTITPEDVFAWGQNDVQPRPGFCSVSVGDVIRIPKDNARYLVDSVGFTELSSEMYKDYIYLDQSRHLKRPSDRYYYWKQEQEGLGFPV